MGTHSGEHTVVIQLTCQILFGIVLVAAGVMDAVLKLECRGFIGSYQCQTLKILKSAFAKMNPQFMRA